ncbi:hypothetical protein ACVGW7_01310, partial [Enterobacter intestinihominis]
SKAIRHRKNNTLRLLPGGAALAPANRYVWPVSAPPPRNTNHKPNKTPTKSLIKKSDPTRQVMATRIPSFA